MTERVRAPDDHEVRCLKDALVPPRVWGTARMTHRRIQNYALARMERMGGIAEVESLPLKLTVESTNICNLRCVACPTGLERDGRRAGHLSIELFTWLMQELGPTLFEVEFHNWGEPLLGKNLLRLVEMASAAGVSSTVSTNFSLALDDDFIDRLVTSGLSVLGVSIDGATQGAYEKYRVRGDIALVLDNCRRLAAAKRRLGSVTPEMFFSFHVFDHNVHEVEEARRIAEEIGMSFSATRAWVLGPEAEGLDEFRYSAGNGFPEPCHFLWFNAVVNHDGGVAPCCWTFNAEDDYARLDLDPASLARSSFRSVWNSTPFVTARRFFTDRHGDEGARRLACFDCPETVDFERWKDALRNRSTTFRRTSSNDMYKWFMARSHDDGPGLVKLRVDRKTP